MSGTFYPTPADAALAAAGVAQATADQAILDAAGAQQTANDAITDANAAALGSIPIGGGYVFYGLVGAIPAGFINANGASLLRAGIYADLFNSIGTTYGSVDGTHFTLPNPTALAGSFQIIRYA